MVHQKLGLMIICALRGSVEATGEWAVFQCVSTGRASTGLSVRQRDSCRTNAQASEASASSGRQVIFDNIALL